MATLREDVGVQPPFETFLWEGARIAFARRGAGRPVLCLHALAHGGRDFEGFAQRMEGQGFEVAALDWPGHGSSEPDPVPGTVDAARFATVLERAIPAIWPGGEAPTVIGNSIGGAAVLHLAARRPELVSSLVLCNSGGLYPINLLARMIMGHMVRFFRAGERGDPGFAARYARYYRGLLREKPAFAQRARIVAAGYEMAPILRAGWENFRRPDADIRHLLPKIRARVLFAWAKQDRLLAWGRAKPAAKRLPQYDLCLLKGGHTAFLEDPDAFASTFTQFARGDC